MHYHINWDSILRGDRLILEEKIAHTKERTKQLMQNPKIRQKLSLVQSSLRKQQGKEDSPLCISIVNPTVYMCAQAYIYLCTIGE